MTANPFETPNADISRGFSDDPSYETPALASRGDRLIAQIFDGLLMLPGIAVGAVLVAMNGGEPEGPLVFAGIGVMALWILGLTIYQWYLISTSGQSLGKRWKEIKIIKQDGSDVDFVSGVILRVWVISALGGLPAIGGLISLLDYVWIFKDEQRCLHDLIAKTDVVDLSIRV